MAKISNCAIAMYSIHPPPLPPTIYAAAGQPARCTQTLLENPNENAVKSHRCRAKGGRTAPPRRAACLRRPWSTTNTPSPSLHLGVSSRFFLLLAFFSPFTVPHILPAAAFSLPLSFIVCVCSAIVVFGGGGAAAAPVLLPPPPAAPLPPMSGMALGSDSSLQDSTRNMSGVTI